MNGHLYNYGVDKINLTNILKGKKIVEILNTIDTSEYLEEDTSDEVKKTDLQTEYKMPTIEIIYVVQD